LDLIPHQIADHSVRLCESGEDCAILFARAPKPGKVKSRLLTHLNAEEACALHCASTSDVASLLAGAVPDARRWLFLSDQVDDLLENFGIRLPEGFGCALQEGVSLGERMAAAFERAFESGARRVVIFGSDSPTLKPEIVQQAFRQLDDCDLTLGPAEDGGYYLIGCRSFDQRLFQEVEWSTSNTFAQTIRNAKKLGYRLAILEQWFDLDEWNDVERLLAAASRGESLPPNIAAFIERLSRRSPIS